MGNFGKLALILAGMFMASQVFGLIDPAKEPMTMPRLLALFESHPEVTTLEQVPAILPDEFLMNFVLKHGVQRKGANGHLVETKVSQSADPLAPRAIIFDERTGFTVSYNGGLPEQTANQRLDIMSFDHGTKKFDLQQIDFPIQGGHPNPSTSDCVKCHGPNMRPIFAMYPDWPAFYGSENDELTNTTAVQKIEFADYQKFLKTTVTTNPRYAALYSPARVQTYLGRKIYPSFPYRPDVSTDVHNVSRAFAFRPELRIGVLYNRLNAQFLESKIKSHPRYDEFAPYFLFNLLQCSWQDGNKASAQKWLTKVKTALKAEPKLLSGRLLDYRQNWSLFDLGLNDVDIRYSYNHEGYNNNDASKKVMETGYIGRYFNAYFDGSATIDELVAASVYEDLAAKTPALRGKVTEWGLVAKYQHLSERFEYDENFFRQMDKLGKWIEMPYPKQLGGVHHREAFTPAFAAEYKSLCTALENTIR
jgi:hypothetical protein